MSLRIDPAELIAGALVIGNTGLGVLGSAVPSTGTHGPGYVYNDLSLPADANKEYIGRILTVPSAGVFFAYEDSSFTLIGAPDGAYSFTYRLFEDGVDRGTATATLVIGAAGKSRPSSDILSTGWTGTPNTVNLYTNTDEVSVDNADYVTSPPINGLQGVLRMGLSAPLLVGTRTVTFACNRLGPNLSQLRVKLLDSGLNALGVSAWQALTLVYATYTATVTIGAVAVAVEVEVQ